MDLEKPDFRMPLTAGFFVILGSLMFAKAVPRQLSARQMETIAYEETVSIEAGRRWYGRVQIISVDGQRYTCSTADLSPLAGVVIAYNPADPSHCREKSSIGTLNSDETVGPFVSAFFVLGGLLALFRFRREWAAYTQRRQAYLSD